MSRMTLRQGDRQPVVRVVLAVALVTANLVLAHSGSPASGATAPSVTDVEPMAGPVEGGTPVTIFGEGLTGVTSVRFGAATVEAEDVSDTRIVAITPAHQADRVDVTVLTSSGSSLPAPEARFTYFHAGRLDPTASPGAVRFGHEATLLGDGRVLLTGGSADGSADLYDPLTRTWSSQTCDPSAPPSADCPGKMSTPRGGPHGATLLQAPGCGDDCGKVLVAGGCCQQVMGRDVAPLKSAELFDPSTGLWEDVAPLEIGREAHTASLLPDGRVLVVDGCYDAYSCGTAAVYDTRKQQPSAEVYDAVLNRWAPMPPPAFGRVDHRATTLTSGKVLISGGSVFKSHTPDQNTRPPPYLAPPEMFDPFSRTWIPTKDDHKQRRVGHSATLLQDGRVLVAGGHDGAAHGTSLISSETYDPSSDTWTASGSLNLPRYGHAGVLLPDGDVLATGDGIYMELWRAGLGPRGQWRPGLISQTSADSAILLSSKPDRFEADPAICGGDCGKVLIVGQAREGQDPTLAAAELYTPAPQVTGIDVNHGPTGGGAVVRIAGTALSGATAANFGATTIECPSPSCRVDSYAQMTVSTPPYEATVVPVTVTTPAGVSERQGAPQFTFYSPPGEVDDLTATGLSGSEVKLTFSAPPRLGSIDHPQQPAQDFIIKQSRDAITTDEQFAGAASLCGGACTFRPAIARVGDRVTLSVTGLTPATGYHYAVKVSEGSSLGPLSNPASATTATVTPGAVTDLAAEALSQNQIKLSFSAAGSDGSQPPPIGDYVIKQSTSPIGDERSFEAARSLCPETCSFSPVAVGDRLTLEVTDLTPGTTYHYALRAKDPHGNFGPVSNRAQATTVGSSADTAPDSMERLLTLRLRGHLVARGRVVSESALACQSKVRVLIKRNGRLLHTVTTKADGRYRLRLADRPGRYRAVVPKVTIADNLCLRAVSEPRKHGYGR